MVRKTRSSLNWSAVLSLIACGSAALPLMARAQDANDSTLAGGLRYGESTQQNDPLPNGDTLQNGDVNQDATQQNANQGVVRLARFAYVKGNVTWRAEDGLDWSQATTNLPIRQGAQIWVTDGGRAELQFDDGSVLRLGNGALVTLKTLYSDEDGEFTQITLSEGLATLRARHERGVYRLDTPLISVTAKGPAKVRLGIGDGVELAVRQGQANIEGSLGKATLESGDYLDLRNADTPYDARRIPGEDNWDRWNAEQDAVMDGAAQRPSHRYLPQNISIVATNLDDNGTWHDDAEYGHVWCPRVTTEDWRPYYHGHWTWVNPFGWTWVSDESWGWAPYHYGTWVSRPYGWAWCPGPVNQYWSPAVVHFCEVDSRVAWVPLCPSEVRYPSVFSIGFHRGNWSLFFSIGQAAVYYPTYNNYCVARPFNTTYVNHVTYINNVTNVYNHSSVGLNRYSNSAEFYAANRNTYLQNNRFIPYNARTAAGVTVASTAGFGTRTAYQAVPRANSAALFTNGRMVSAPAGRQAPVAGPMTVRPTPEALTPSHTFAGNARPSQSMMARPVYQAPLPTAIARRAVPITPAGQPVTINRPVNNAPTGSGSRTGRTNGENGANGSSARPTTPGALPGHTPGSANTTAPSGGVSTGRPVPGTYGSNTTGRQNTGVNGSANSSSPRVFRPSSPSNGGSTGNSGSGGTATTRPTTNDTNSRLPGRNGGEGTRRPDGAASSSAAQAAQQARAGLGMRPGRSGSGDTGNVSRPTGGNSSGTADRANRPNTGSGGTGREYRPSSTGGSGNSSSGSGTTGSVRPSQPPNRSNGDGSSPRSYSPRTGGSGSADGSSPRTYSPPTRTGSDGYAPRTGTPPTRTYSPPADNTRNSGGSGTPNRTTAPPASSPRTSSPPASRPAPTAPSHDRSSDGGSRDSGRDKSDKSDKGGKSR